MNDSSGSSTVTMSKTNHSLSNSEYLSSSQSSFGPSKKVSSEISKVYKQASQLFLTRRLSEALSTLRPVITPPAQTNGNANGEYEGPSLSPIASATTSQRIKVWSLYVTLLNAIVDLGIDEGKRDFGQKEYKTLVASVRDGDVWEQVVRGGYGGREVSVDAEVVYNLYVQVYHICLELVTDTAKCNAPPRSSYISESEPVTSRNLSLLFITTEPRYILPSFKVFFTTDPFSNEWC